MTQNLEKTEKKPQGAPQPAATAPGDTLGRVASLEGALRALIASVVESQGGGPQMPVMEAITAARRLLGE